MKRYGFRMGGVGLEFLSRDERDKGIILFTHCVTVKVSDRDIRYKQEGTSVFGTYERDDKEVLVNCSKCEGVFSSESCPKRNYPLFYSWKDKGKQWESLEGHICDGCLAKEVKAKEVAAAKDVLATEG